MPKDPAHNPYSLCLALAFLVSQSAAAEGTPSAAPKSHAQARESRAEVEISGTLQISEKPARLFVFVSRQACDPRHVERDMIGSVRIDPFVGSNFFIEVFVPQGSTGNVCGAALDDKGNIVGFGAYPKNPLTFRGEGEVTFGDVVFPLRPLKKPVAAPPKFKG